MATFLPVTPSKAVFRPSNPLVTYRAVGNVLEREISATTLNFNYQTAKLPPSIGRGNFRAKFEPKTGTVQGTAALRIFNINANPLVDYAPVAGTFTFIGQRVKP